MSQPLEVPRAISQVALVIPLFSLLYLFLSPPPVIAFFMSIARLCPCVSQAIFTVEVLISEDMVTILSCLVSVVSPLHFVSLALVVEAKLLPHAMILAVVWLVHLAMHCGTSQ